MHRLIRMQFRCTNMACSSLGMLLMAVWLCLHSSSVSTWQTTTRSSQFTTLPASTFHHNLSIQSDNASFTESSIEVNSEFQSGDGWFRNEHHNRATKRDFLNATQAPNLTAKHVHPVGRQKRIVTTSTITTFKAKSSSISNIQASDIRQSAYVCEDGILELSCTAGKHIDVLRANFGRFSITLCNPSGFLDWSVNCASGNSLPVLTERCSGKKECSIQASSFIFGDPCPSTSKYLEVHYRCSSGLEINSNRNLTSPTAVAVNNRKLSDNDSASSGNVSPIHNYANELISPENSLSPQVSTSTQSSIGSLLGKNSSSVPNSSLNQDLLLFENYLNTKCNQPASVETYYDNKFKSAKCKQIDDSQHHHNSAGSSPTEQHRKVMRIQETSHPSEQHRSMEASTSNPSLITIEGYPPNDRASNLNMPLETVSEGGLLNKVSLSGNTMIDHHNRPGFGVPSQKATTGGEQAHHATNTDSAVVMDNGQWSSTHDNVSATCQSIIYRGIEWPHTAIDSIAIRPCPVEASGLAQWKCSYFRTTSVGQLAAWNSLPDLSQCHSRWLLELYSFQNVNNFRNDMWKSILATLTHSSFYGGDILELNSIFEASLKNFFDKTYQQKQQQQPNKFLTPSVQHLTSIDTVLEIVSLLLAKENEQAWFDLPAPKRQMAALGLIEIAMKYATLHCLDRRHFNSQKEVIKQSAHLLISCYSISKLLNEFQLNWQARKNISNEFKFKLFSSPQMKPNDITVYMIVNALNFQTILNENIFFGTLIPFNVARYFTLADISDVHGLGQKWAPLSLQPKHSIKLDRPTFEDSDGLRFINSYVIKFFQFNHEQIITNSSNDANLYAFEMVFKHLRSKADMFTYECVHWDSAANKWSNEQCALIQSNATHSICRCNVVSTCTVLATQHLTNNSNELHASQLSMQALTEHNFVLSVTLIAYMWIAMLLTRCHVSYFNRFNFSPLLIACTLRTLVELCIIWNAFWPELAAQWCTTLVLVIVYQLQVISCNLAVFLFQNVILLVLANKIYLSKNYVNSTHAMAKCKQIQTFVSVTFPLINLVMLHLFTEKRSCWPHFEHTQIINAVFVTSPITQTAVVLVAGLLHLHCWQRIFSHYDYPHVHSIHPDTSLLEKHIKNVFFARCQQSVLWLSAVCLYLFCAVGCLCSALLWRNVAYGLTGLDISLSLAFLLFLRIKYLSKVLVKCKQSTPVHCSSTKDHPTLASIRDNSISILSESSKSFLTLPGQISLSKMLDSPKIYPSSHQSSSTYARNSNPSSHVYESPKHLYNYEFEQCFYPDNCPSTLNGHNRNKPNRNNFYPLQVNNPIAASIGVSPLYHSPDSDSTNINLSLRPHVSSYHTYRQHLAALDRSNSIFSS